MFFKIKLKLLICAFLLLICISNGQTENITQTIKVSVDGKDTSALCKKNELSKCLDGLTLEGAFEWIRGPEVDRMRRGGKVSVTIQLSPGIYRLSAPLVTNWGATDSHGMLAIIGPNTGAAVISGAHVVNEFSLVRDSQLKKIPDEAKGHVLEASLKSFNAGGWRSPVERGFGRSTSPVLLEVFSRGEPMQVAGWPDNGFGRIIEYSSTPTKGDKRFGIEGHDITRLIEDPDIVAKGYFARDWAEESIPVEKIDIERNEIVLSDPGPQFGIKNGMRVRLENALSELDHAGEWYLDRGTDILYFWPLRALKAGDVEVSLLDTLLKVVGAKDVRIANLQFEKSRGDALTITDSENVVLEKSLIRYTGNRGVVISGGRNSGLREVSIENTGEGGVVLQGGARKTLIPANLFVDSCKITRFSRLSSTYRPAVLLRGVGNKVVHCTISDAPHSAIMFYGNDHLIAFNNISDVVQDTDDAGAIYTGRNWTARGTVIEGNFLHDIGGRKNGQHGAMGVYLDDQSSGVTVRGNLFARVTQPVFIGGGRDNLVEQNMIFYSSPALHLDARGLNWQRAETFDHKKPWLQSLDSVPYNRPPYSDRYPHLADIRKDDLGAPKYNVARHNLMIGSSPFDIKKGAESGITLKNNFWDRDAIFLKLLSPEQRRQPDDFRLDQSSPAIMNGFVMPSLDKMAY